MKKEVWNKLVLASLALAVALLVADCVWLHVTCSRQQAELTALAEQQRKTAEQQAKTAKMALELEKWIETSSVEGRLKTYRKQVGDECRQLGEKVREIKDAAVKSLEAARGELKK